MTTLYIGAKFDGHDSAIFLILPNKKRVFGLATERLTRQKHDDIFPIAPLERIIGYAHIDQRTVTNVLFANAFSSDRNTMYPVNKLSRDLASRGSPGLSGSAVGVNVQACLNAGLHEQCHAPALAGPMPALNEEDSEIQETLHQCMMRHLHRLFPTAAITVRHHDHEYCHALSSYFFSPFEVALLLTMDGVGDDGIFSRVYIAKNGDLKSIAESHSKYRISDPTDPAAQFSKPCTLGGIYSYFTYKLGFKANCDEGKVEALAALGVCIPEIYDRLMASVRICKTAHAIQIDCHAVGDAISHPQMGQSIDIESKANLAATVQRFTEDVVLAYIEYLVAETGMSTLCLSGGVFANVILNMKIAERISAEIFVAPAVGDDGSAQGAAVAELLWGGYSHEDLRWLRDNRMPYFGTSYSRKEIIDSLIAMPDEMAFEDLGQGWPEEIADRIHGGAVGAIFQGRMEWGPRALGNRSIVVSPTNPRAKEIVNEMVKRRLFFQPVCPSILVNEMDRLFESAYFNRHMTCAFKMRQEMQRFLPGAIHFDGTSRVQFVDQDDNPMLFRLLVRLRELSGFGVVLNTSFNMHGRTIVESPEDALRDFLDMGLDFLVIEGYLVTRSCRDPQTLHLATQIRCK